MTRSTMKFAKGIMVGTAVGCVMGMVGCCYLKSHKKCVKKSMSRALRNMSDLVENVNGMF